jgi:hypothetical protein
MGIKQQSFFCFRKKTFTALFRVDLELAVELLQRVHHKLLDNFFSVLSCIVSVPFYTGFLPLLFWVRPPSCLSLLSLMNAILSMFDMVLFL